MKIEKAVCPHCGGPIEIGSCKIIKCEYCGMPIVISDLDIDKSDKNGSANTASKITASTYDKWGSETPIENRTKTNRKSSYWTPVGFRSKTKWKMCVAILVYLPLLELFLIPEDRVAMITAALVSLFSIHVAFSWQPFVDHFPGLKSGNDIIRVISKVAYILAAFMIAKIIDLLWIK